MLLTLSIIATDDLNFQSIKQMTRVIKKSNKYKFRFILLCITHRLHHFDYQSVTLAVVNSSRVQLPSTTKIEAKNVLIKL